MDLEALLAHARALVGVELGALADALGLAGAGRAGAHQGVVGAGDRARAGRRDRRRARARLRGAGDRAEDGARDAGAGAARIDRGLPDRSDRDRGRIVGDELRAREAGARAVRGARGAARRALGRRSARRGRAAVGARRPTRKRRCAPTSSCSCASTSVAAAPPRSPATSGGVLQVRPKGRDAADLRDAYDAEGRPTRIGKCGFYLRPAFVARILAARERRVN